MKFSLYILITLALASCSEVESETRQWKKYWGQYQSAKIGFLKERLINHNDEQADVYAEIQEDAHRNLVEIGELIEVTDLEIIQIYLNAGLVPYRYGDSMIGGQWPIGREYFNSIEIKLFNETDE